MPASDSLSPWWSALSALLLTGPGLALAGLLLLAVGAVAWQWRRGRALQQQLLAQREAMSTLRSDDDDPLVPGLVSRARFDKLLDRAVRGSDRAASGHGSRQPVVVLFINLDDFRSVNECHGYLVGDQVIAQVARQLMALAGGGGKPPVMARLGADEFLLLHLGDLVSGCALAGRLCQALAEPMDVPGHGQVVLGGSIGLAAHPEHGSRSRLVAHASAAMQAVKRAGGGDFMVFEPRMAVDQRDQAELQADLRQAVARGELELYYQPKVDAKTLQITAAEALLRWHHPSRGLVSPAVFIPIAERSGLIRSIGNWVIDDACRQAAAWRDEGLRMRVAINLSAYQMRQDDVVDRIEAGLRQHRLRPERFTVEITESVAMEDTQVTQRAFERLRAAGVHVSIDDFGVGQASLSYLRRLPAAELKIDASFVRDVATRDDARTIVDAVVRMAHALRLKVVAEGVETDAQRDRLVKLGCDELQGYLFAKPMAARALGAWAQLDAAESQRAQAPQGSSFSPALFQDTDAQQQELALRPLR